MFPARSAAPDDPAVSWIPNQVLAARLLAGVNTSWLLVAQLVVPATEAPGEAQALPSHWTRSKLATVSVWLIASLKFTVIVVFVATLVVALAGVVDDTVGAVLSDVADATF